MGWAHLLEPAAGSSLWQIAALDTEAREESGALNFSGIGPGAARRHHLCAAPLGVASSGFAMGYSLGSNILLNCLAETAGASPLRAAVAVSVPLDLKATQVRMMMPRNRVYQHYLLRGLCTSNLAGPAVTPVQRETITRRVHSLYDYDDLVVAPANGFEGAEDYYASCSSGRRLGEIKTETLVIHAADDPWIPLAAYQAIDWPALPSQLRLSLTNTGGHVGFHQAGEAIPWHDRASATFFDAR